MEAIIEARGVGHRFKNLKVLDSIQFEIPQGQTVGITGAAGSGKTTLMRILAGMIVPSEGELFILDLSTRMNSALVRGRVGMMPEREGFDLQLTVLDSLLIHGALYGISRRQLLSRGRELLRIVQLDEAEEWPVFELKRVQMRRLALARALITSPEILLIDGPGRDLSPTDKKSIWQLIQAQREKGLTIIVASRELDDIENFCDRVMILERGRMICQGEPKSLVQFHVGKDVVEYEIEAHDLDYYLQSIGQNLQFQVVGSRLKVFVPETVDTWSALRWVPSERVLVRRARLRDVYAKIVGHESTGAAL